jgi:mRNA interferase RelE/StbE
MVKFKPLFTVEFSKIYSKLNKELKERIDKAIDKILLSPEKGKPLKYELAGLRSARIGKFRLLYEIKGDTIIFHTFEHRKKVYK